VIVDCVGDLHGAYPKLEGGDLLIVAGDCTTNDKDYSWDVFYEWLAAQKYEKKIYIGGNHDNRLTMTKDMTPKHCDAHYLCDSATSFEGLKIWGSPWTLTFPGINPHCTAFTGDEELLASKFALIPDDIDILITHGPPYGIMDMVDRGRFTYRKQIENVGSVSLSHAVARIRPLLHVYGHIHQGYGQCGAYFEGAHGMGRGVHYINCSHMNEDYEPVNKPIRVIL